MGVGFVHYMGPFTYYVMAFFLIFDSPLPPCYAIYVIKCYGFVGLAIPPSSA